MPVAQLNPQSQSALRRLLEVELEKFAAQSVMGKMPTNPSYFGKDAPKGYPTEETGVSQLAHSAYLAQYSPGFHSIAYNPVYPSEGLQGHERTHAALSGLNTDRNYRIKEQLRRLGGFDEQLTRLENWDYAKSQTHTDEVLPELMNETIEQKRPLKLAELYYKLLDAITTVHGRDARVRSWVEGDLQMPGIAEAIIRTMGAPANPPVVDMKEVWTP